MVEPRVLGLLEVWSWLPAFRFVAETEHLPTAGDLLYTSPSALSRTVRQLEASLGVELFNRVGRRMLLNDDGRRLLAGVRRAMRYVDDVVQDLGQETTPQVLNVHSTTQLGTAWLLAALPALRRQHPWLTVHLVPAPGDLVSSLLQGRLDLVVCERALRHAELTTARLGEGTSGVYCGRDHPLFRARRVTLARVQEHAFVAPPDLPGPPLDDWPPELQRTVGLRVDQVRVALQACLDGDLLAILPDDVAARPRERRELRRLPLDVVPPSTVYALTRQVLHPRDGAGKLLSLLRAARSG